MPDMVNFIRHEANVAFPFESWGKSPPWATGRSELCSAKTLETLFCIGPEVNDVWLHLHSERAPGSIAVHRQKTTGGSTTLILDDMPDGLVEPGQEAPAAVWQSEHALGYTVGPYYLTCSEGHARPSGKWQATWDSFFTPEACKLRCKNTELRKQLADLKSRVVEAVNE